MGKNYLGDTGKLLAKKLEWEEPNRYTGHCFQQSGATCAANQGANTMKIMRQFNWRNEATALQYTDATKEQGRKIAGYVNQVTPMKKRSRQEEPIPGPSGVAGHSQAAVADEDFVGSSEVAPISPEKEKTQ